MHAVSRKQENDDEVTIKLNVDEPFLDKTWQTLFFNQLNSSKLSLCFKNIN